jgi:hypothetical protein
MDVFISNEDQRGTRVLAAKFKRTIHPLVYMPDCPK